MVWYSHFFKSFPQFVMTHAVKGSNLASETEVNVFLEFPCVGNLISGSSAFLNPAYKFGSSHFT